ncbi:hypothetical protein GMMP15_1560001 [Candidatus Magnetomoraceae bacterium gMMP-15]
METEEKIGAINVITGIGYPSFTNLNWMVSSMMRLGIPIEAARNSGVVGCVSCCPVDSCNTIKRLALTIIASKSLELALNKGVCPVTGKKIGPDEKPAAQFKSYEEVLKAYRKQLEFAIKTAVNVRNLARCFEKKYRPNPLASALHKTTIKKGIDAVGFEDYPNNSWLNMVGLINVVNSLAVLKKFVFEEKRYNMADFLEAMKNNWEGKEIMRQECMNKVPKYGNDNPYVDDIAHDVYSIAADIAENTYDINGGFWSIIAQSVSIYKATAKMTGAMPDSNSVYKNISIKT